MPAQRFERAWPRPVWCCLTTLNASATGAVCTVRWDINLRWNMNNVIIVSSPSPACLLIRGKCRSRLPCHPRESGDPWPAPRFLDSHFRGNDILGGGKDGLGGPGEQREITRFPIGHVKPCPYGTYETSLVTFPVNGRHAVPLPK